MKLRKIILALPLALMLTASLGVSQSGGSGSNNGNGTVTGNGSATLSNSNSGADASIINNSTTNNNSTNQRQFNQALPGPSDTVFPGYAPKNDSCHVLYPPPLRNPTMDEVRSMAKGNKLDKHQMHIDVVDRKAVTKTGDPVDVHLVPYWAKLIAFSDDIILASVIIPGKYLHTEEELLGVALLEAEKVSHARRYSVMECPEVVSHTSSHGGGIGAAGADVPGSGSTANAFSLGFSFGTNNAEQQEHQIIYVLALNDNGHYDAPGTQRQPDSAQAAAPTPPPAPQPQPTPTPPPPPQAAVAPAPAPQAPQPPAPAPAPTAPLAPQVAQTPPPDLCSNIQPLTILFVFNHYEVKPEYLDGIKAMAGWVKDHPMCKVQVQGHASREGSVNYNIVLGNNRSDAVYNLLLADGAPKDKLEYASLGKDFPKSDYEPLNRRVILVVQGSASGQ
jgi:outer membrane protein OmpA-like peptidoglycan-associated protein